MSRLLQEYVNLEAERRRIDELLERLQNDDRLKAEMQFKKDIEDVLEAHGKTSTELLQMFAPPEHQKAQPQRRRKRSLKVYKNPHTGETVETRGGNNKTLRAWKDEFGDQDVESWVVEVRDPV